MSTFKKKSDIHIARKIWHLCGILIITFFVSRLHKDLAISLISLITGLCLLLDITRLKFKKLNNIVLLIAKPVLRESEKNSLAGISYLLTGVLTILVLFNKDIVILSLLCLAFGDPLASYVGIKFGSIKIFNTKSLQGSFAAFFICTILSALFFMQSEIMMRKIIIAAPLSGLIAAFSEALPVGEMDDNLTFPIISSLLFSVLFYLMGFNYL